jgi:hypothetical protein
MDDLKKYGAVIDTLKEQLRLGDEVFPLFNRIQNKGNLILSETVFLPSRMEKVIMVDVPYGDSTILTVESGEETLGITVIHTLTEVRNNKMPVVISNVGEESIVLKKGALIGRAAEVQEVRQIHVTDKKKGENATPVSLAEIGVNLDKCELPENERNSVLEVLMKNREIFAKGTWDRGFCAITTHRITIADNQTPIRQYPYRVPYHQKKEIEDQVTKMLDSGIISPSYSPWAAPVVLVKKKNGEWRLCVDYRKLNEVTKKDTYPIPRIDDTIDNLRGCKYFSTMDLQNGYHQIAMDAADKEKTAFVTHEGLYEFNVMPFGMSTAPATFQRLMSGLLKDMQGKASAYLDDILICSKSLEEHCETLEEVFRRLDTAGLKVNGSKCHFGAKSVKYLGYVVSDEGIQTDEDKVKAVSAFPEPKNLTQLRSFLGLVGYYRRFVEKFATISEPLIELTRKGTLFHWNNARQHAFEELKFQLSTAPILQYPDFTKEFRLSTDASDYGVGAVLSQLDQEGRDKPIAFASRTLNSAEKNYAVVEKEALAMIWAIQYFRHYLWGKPCRILTDHAPLRWLLRKQSTSARLQRWALKLQDFNVTDIEYRKGETNVVADALSRNPIVEALNIIQQEIVDHPGLQLDNFAVMQRKDAALKEIIDYLLVPDAPLPENNVYASEIASFFVDSHDALFKMQTINRGGKENAVLVVPRAMVTEVLSSCHSEPLAGHFGFAKTWGRVKSRFYWKRMGMDTKNFCDACLPCQTRKTMQKPAVEMQSLEVNEPMSVWAMDICGPFPESEDGNKYILVMGDLFTKWIEAVALKEVSAPTVARAMVDQVICRFGAPRMFLSDQGANFMSEFVGEVMDICNSTRVRTCAFHPQTNGFIERFNKTMAEQLSMYVSHDQKDWDKFLQPVLWAYRTVEQASSGFTPYEAMFGASPRLPVDVALREGKTYGDLTEYSRKLILRLQNTRTQLLENLKHAREMQAKYYNRKANPKQFEEGDWILLFKPQLNATGVKKLTHPYAGPFKVIKKHNEHNYTVEEPRTAQQQRVNVQRMKLYKGEVATDLWQDTKEDVEMLKGELRPRRGRPRKTNKEEVEENGEEIHEEIEAIKGERMRRNRNGLLEKQYLVHWTSNGEESWKWARDIQAPRLIEEWEGRQKTAIAAVTETETVDLPKEIQVEDYESGTCVVEVSILNKAVDMYVDTGSCVTTISEAWIQQHAPHIKRSRLLTPYRYFTAEEGSVSVSTESVVLEVTYEKTKFWVQALIMPRMSVAFLLGRNSMQQLDMILYMRQNFIVYGDGQVMKYSQKPEYMRFEEPAQGRILLAKNEQQRGERRKLSYWPNNWNKVWLFLILIYFLFAGGDSGGTTEEFFQMSEKTQNPIYLCGSGASHYFHLPGTSDCENFEGIRYPTATYNTDIYAIPQATQSMEACFCWRTEETCEYTNYFFGAKVSKCRSSYVDISHLECKSACFERVSADGKLEAEDAAQYRTKNEIKEAYAWPTTLTLTARNTWTQKIPAIIGHGKDRPVTAGVPLAKSCSVHQEYCEAYHHGFVLWIIPKSFRECNVEKIVSVTCEQYEDLRCTSLNAAFDLNGETELCGRKMWKTKQGPYLILQKTPHSLHGFHQQLVQEHKKRWHVAHPQIDRDWLGWTFQELSNRVNDLRVEESLVFQKLGCEWQNRLLIAVKNLLPLFPQLVASLIPDENVGIELHGDLVRVSQCTNVSRYRILEDDPCIMEIPIEYEWHGKLQQGFLSPVTHRITKSAIKRKDCHRNKFLRFGNFSFNVATRQRLEVETLPIHALKFAGLNWKRMVISPFGPNNVDEGFLPLQDFTSQIIYEHWEKPLEIKEKVEKLLDVLLAPFRQVIWMTLGIMTCVLFALILYLLAKRKLQTIYDRMKRRRVTITSPTRNPFQYWKRRPSFLWGKVSGEEGKSEATHATPWETPSAKWGTNMPEAEGIELRSLRTEPLDDEEKDLPEELPPKREPEHGSLQAEDEMGQQTTQSPQTTPRKTPVWSKRQTKL